VSKAKRSSDKGCAFFKNLKKLAHIVESKVFGNVAAQTLAAFFVLLAIYSKNVILKIESSKTVCFLKFSSIRIQQLNFFFSRFLYIVQVSSQK
jgi:hypothetical protein